MANEEQLKILSQGVAAWNQWREENPEAHIDFIGADLSGMYLSGVNLIRANLSRADFSEADISNSNLFEADLSNATLFGTRLIEVNLSQSNLIRADFNGANLSWSNLERANLFEANLPGAYFLWSNLSEANLMGACLNGANLTGADLSDVDLSGADLIGSILVDVNLERSILKGCRVYGLSAWRLRLKDAKQKDLIITPYNEPSISVDNLEVAQFIYLLLNNEKIRYMIDTITSKVVLILGRFTLERKAILDAIREELRRCNYVPVLFDFEKPDSRDFTETISTLARMARFIIADITDPKSIPLELQAVIPHLAVPVQPLLAEGSSEFSMFRDLRRKYDWVLQVYIYKDLDNLISSLSEKVIAPAEEKVKELKESCT